MAMTGGIGYEIDQLAKLGVPELMRRQSIDPQLKYALALQEATKMVEAAARERDMAQQMPMPADVVGQMETSLAKRLAPGVQQQGQRSMQMQNRAAMGLPGQAAPNLARMANGGIVGYADGGDVMGPPEPNLYQRMGQGLKNYGTNAQESMDMLRAAKAGVGVPYEKRSAAIQQVRDEIEAQKQNRDPNFIQRMGQKLMDAGLNLEESKSILKKFYDTFGKTYEEMSNGMAMGGKVKGYAGPDGSRVEAARPYMKDGKFYTPDGQEITQASYEQLIDLAEQYDAYQRSMRNQELRDAVSSASADTVAAARGGEEPTAAQEVDTTTFDPYNRREGRPFYAPDSQAARMVGGIKSIGDFIAAPFREGAQRAEPSDIREGVVELASMMGISPSTEAREVPITSGQPMPQNAGITAGMYDVRNMAPTAQQKLGSMVNRPSAVLKDNAAEMAARAPKESGIAALMQKARPFADKASDIAKLLGRGAGASEGYEFAKIGEESRKIEALNRAFGQEKELKQMDIAARDAELGRRLTEAAKLAGQEIRLDAYNNAVAQMRMDSAYTKAVEKLREQYTTGTNDYIPFNERFDEEGFNKALLDYEENYIKNKVLAAERIAGVGQEGTTQTPATQRYQVVQ